MKSKLFIIGFLLLFYIAGSSQELFVYTEPASNMPAKSVGLRVTNMMMKDIHNGNINYHLLPEVMWGVTKNLMVHGEAFVSNRKKNLVAEGGGAYAKYRFLSKDNVHSHFRMAGFGRVSYNNSDIHQEEIETNAHNSGYEAGLVATQLLNKVALSALASFEKALDNNSYKFPAHQSNSAMNYTFSFGKLMLPQEYTDYKQTNLNLMVELLAQRLNSNGKYFIDISPSLQVIVNSQTRIDLGYRHQLKSSMLRTAPNGFLIRVEHLLFNVL
ncbi:MAG: hypothetical protein JWQ96_3243 [Segetibacter sp.]|nr:hypothetical protein [Segetibacter sp.]